MVKEKSFKAWWAKNQWKCLVTFFSGLICAAVAVINSLAYRKGVSDMQESIDETLNDVKKNYIPLSYIADMAEKTTKAVNDGESLPELEIIGDEDGRVKRISFLDNNEVQFWD